MNDKCFAKCLYKPGASLSSSDEACLSRCMDRCARRLAIASAEPASYLEAFNVVSQSYARRLTHERQAAGALALDPSVALGGGEQPELL